MIEDYGILLLQMMENAGRNLAHLARRRFLDSNPIGRRVVVLAGTGGNEGGGLVAARHLHNWGAAVHVVTTAAATKMAEVPRHQFGILDRMGVSAGVARDGAALPPAELIIDAIIGYSLGGAPAGAAASLIRVANAAAAPVLALDVPSGVDAASGASFEPSIEATATLTLGLPKVGFRSEQARDRIGELYLADISVPRELYAGPKLNFDVGPLFADDDILRVW